jgi:hypothetical protein
MAKHSGRFTTSASPDPTIKQRVRKAVADAAATLRAAAEKIPPETKEAVAEIAEQLKADQDDPPASAPASPAPDPTPPTTAPAPVPKTKPRHGEQSARAERVLRTRLYPPDGKVPVGITIKAVTGKVADALVAEREEELAPKNEEGLSNPSPDVVGLVMKKLGRTA